MKKLFVLLLFLPACSSQIEPKPPEKSQVREEPATPELKNDRVVVKPQEEERKPVQVELSKSGEGEKTTEKKSALEPYFGRIRDYLKEAKATIFFEDLPSFNRNLVKADDAFARLDPPAKYAKLQEVIKGIHKMVHECKESKLRFLEVARLGASVDQIKELMKQNTESRKTIKDLIDLVEKKMDEKEAESASKQP